MEPTDLAHVQAVQRLIVAGHTAAAIRPTLIERGVGAAAVDDIIAAARLALAAAANVDLVEQFGTAVARLNSLYTDARKSDHRSALAVQRELNRLLGLYGSDRTEPGSVADSESSSELEAIGMHLRPLGLLPAELPLSEHARIAASLIVEQRSKTMTRDEDG